jgi:hypothetical protein
MKSTGNEQNGETPFLKIQRKQKFKNLKSFSG